MPTTLISIPQSNLTKNATFNSMPTPGPIAIPAVCTSLTCTLNMSSADQTNTSNAISWVVYLALPGPAPTLPPPNDGTPGNGWMPIDFEQWHGGTFVNQHTGQSQPNPVTYNTGIDPAYQGGWIAAAGQNIGITFKVGCTVVSNP